MTSREHAHFGSVKWCIIRCKNRAVLKRGRTHHGPHDGPRSSILKRVRHLRTAGQGHIANDALEMISCNEFSYSHGSVTLLGTSHAI